MCAQACFFASFILTGRATEVDDKKLYIYKKINKYVISRRIIYFAILSREEGSRAHYAENRTDAVRLKERSDVKVDTLTV